MKTFITILISLLSCAAQAQVNIGDAAPEISLPDAGDSSILLSSLKGKVVLIDFWASWCGPCRQALPSLVRLHKKYKDKGFEIYAVSLDQKKTEWQRAVKYYRIKYTSVFDVNAWNSQAAARYGVEAIPACFLLDKEGKILAIDPEKKDLEKLLKEQLGQ